MPESHEVLLFYKYVQIDDPVGFVDEQRRMCESLALKGRILVATEGINGTIAGSVASTREYAAILHADSRFTNVEFKSTSGDAETFPKLTIKARKEIVTLGLREDVDPTHDSGTRLSPAQWKEMIENDDVVLFDARNRIESDVGRFEGAITPQIEHFREFPNAVAEHSELKERKVLMYCTGGIRCEKASALLKREGFQHVYQLDGGIIKYLQEIGTDHWVGDCFTFDQRMIIPGANAGHQTPAERCEHSGKPSRHIINCLHEPCHRLFVVSEEALRENEDRKLCPDCLAKGFTRLTADYKGSPTREQPLKSSMRRS